MKEEINEIIKTIFNQHPYNKNAYSLLSGLSGQLLFEVIYCKHFNGDIVEEQTQDQLQMLAEETFRLNTASFGGGRAGIYWFFTFLYKSNYLDEDTWSLICSSDDALANEAIRLIGLNNYDFLHGSLGIASYLIYKSNFTDQSFFKKILEEIQRLIDINGDAVPWFNFDRNDIDPSIVNLGLAHGLPSILKYCLICFEAGICKEHAADLARHLANYIHQHANKNTSQCYFPNAIEVGISETDPSRLAWCYGDLGLAYVLYQYGLIFKDKVICEFALEVLKASTMRRDPKDTYVSDGGICHGSAGIAHIYNRLWNLTGDPIFKNASEYWIEQLVLFLDEGRLDNNRVKFNPKDRSFEQSLSILEGTAGIGLVLMSFLFQDFTWDYCLMLN